MDLCCIEGDDSGTLDSRMAAFCSDRSMGSVTGPRRMGRGELVDRVAGVLRASGRRVSVFPSDMVERPDAIIFYHWRDIDEAYVSSNPGADVLYGQDLCHQVPAVVRVVKAARSLRHPHDLYRESRIDIMIS